MKVISAVYSEIIWAYGPPRWIQVVLLVELLCGICGICVITLLNVMQNISPWVAHVVLQRKWNRL